MNDVLGLYCLTQFSCLNGWIMILCHMQMLGKEYQHGLLVDHPFSHSVCVSGERLTHRFKDSYFKCLCRFCCDWLSMRFQLYPPSVVLIFYSFTVRKIF